MTLLLLACAGPDPKDHAHDGVDTHESAPADTAEAGPSDAGEWASVSGAPADALGNALAPAGDPDGDGDPDLLVAAYLGNRVCVLGTPVPGGASTLDGLEAACFSGEAEYDYAGYGTAPAGDADGDGRDDLLVGSIGNTEQGANAGKVYLLTGPVRAGASSLGEAPTTWVGEGAGDYAGIGLAAVGDLSGDAAADLLVGASGYDGGGVAGGRVYVVAGPAKPGASRLADAYASVTGLGDGPKAAPPPHGAFGVGDFVGGALSPVGDLDGDGLEDLALGATGDASAGPNTGKLVVFRGPLVPGDHSAADADLVVTGSAAGSYTGSPVTGGADVTGDGRADLFVSADGLGAGVVWLVAGGVETGTLTVETAWARFEGAAEDDLFGFATSAGDADGDGATDLLVGSPGSDRAGYERGAAWLFTGPLTTGAHAAADAAVHVGEVDADAFGAAVAIAGDLDLDGAPDLAVGAYNSDANGGFSGTVYLIAP
jgi:hypothetical protein